MSFDSRAYGRERYRLRLAAGECVICGRKNDIAGCTCSFCRLRAKELRVAKAASRPPPPLAHRPTAPSESHSVPDMNKVTAFLTGKPVLHPMPEGIEWNHAVTIVRIFAGGRHAHAQTRDRHEAERLWRQAKSECLEISGPIRVSIYQGMKTFLTVKRLLPALRVLPAASPFGQSAIRNPQSAIA